MTIFINLQSIRNDRIIILNLFRLVFTKSSCWPVWWEWSDRGILVVSAHQHSTFTAACWTIAEHVVAAFCNPLYLLCTVLFIS